MDTKEESSRLLKEAEEDFDRANRYSELNDWVTVVHYSQLAIEKSVKSLISCFEAFEWTHDPSEQLKKLIKKGFLNDEFLEIVSYSKEVAPWHGRSTYGGLKDGHWGSPSELCTEDVAKQLLNKANKSFNEVNPVRNSSGALNSALRGGTPYGAEPGINLKCNPAAAAGPGSAQEGLLPRREQRGIISNGVKSFIERFFRE